MKRPVAVVVACPFVVGRPLFVALVPCPACGEHHPGRVLRVVDAVPGGALEGFLCVNAPAVVLLDGPEPVAVGRAVLGVSEVSA